MSNTLYVGQTASVSLGAHDSITVSSENATGALTFTSNDNNLLGDFSASIQSKTYGPYGHPTAVVIRPTSGRVVYTHNLSSVDPTLSQVARAGTGAFSPINPVKYVLAINNGEAIDTAIAAWIATVRASATASTSVRIGVLEIPGGSYVMSSTTATITLEPWMSLKMLGNVFVNCNGHSVPVIWIRGDVTPALDQGHESDYSNHVLIDGSNGVLALESNNPGTATAIRFGCGDGVWGTNYTGDTGYSVKLIELSGIHVMFFDHGIQFTNNNAFCLNAHNIWISNTDYALVTSTSDAETNTYEQHRFHKCFFGNIYHSAILMQSGGARDHQFAISESSITQVPESAVRLTTSAYARIELSQMRLENCLDVVNCADLADTPVSSPRSWVRLSNVTIIPTNTYNSLTTHMRRMFRGDFNLQHSNTVFDLTSGATWATVGYSQASNQFLCDSTVKVQGSAAFAQDPPSTVEAQPYMRVQPMWQASSARNFNSAFEEATLAGWTTGGTGAVVRTTTADEFYEGTAGMQMTIAAQYASATSANIRVEAGKDYFGSLVFRVPTAGVVSPLCLILQIIWYARDGTTVLRTDTQAQTTGNQNIYNRRSDTQWHLHQSGTGRRSAPAGAEFAAFVINFTGGATTTTNGTGEVYIDNAVFVQL